MFLKNKIRLNSILFFFIFGTLFLTIRLLIMGSEASKTVSQYILAMLPELLVLIIMLLFIIPHFQKRIKFKLNQFDWFLMFYILTNVLIGIFVAKDFKLSLYGIRMTYLPMLFYFISAQFSFSIVQFKFLLDAIFNWLVAVAIIGLILYFGFSDAMITMINKTGAPPTEYFIVRMTSIFWSPVVFGTFMTCAFLYFFYQSTQNISIINYVCQAIISICVFLSVTRGSMIVLFIGLLILAILSKKWKPFLISLTILIVMFLSVAYYIATPSIFIDWILHSASETIGLKAGVTRVDLWIHAFADFKEHPFGRGLGKAGHVAARFFQKPSNEASVTSTDGWFLKLANETGVLGLLSYFILSIFLFIASISYIRKYGYDFFCFLFVIFLIINVQNLVSNVLDFYLFSYLYWMIIGIMNLHFKSKVISNG